MEYANTDVRNFAINKIKNGQPVMLLLGDATGFHFVVAYDLDDKGTEDNSDDDIYAHYGWYNDKVHINIDTDEFDLLVSAMALNFNIAHNHAYNYEDSYGNTYCSCYFPVHPEHVHSYAQYNSVSHQYTCGCVANTQYANHRFDAYQQISDTNHIGICVDCGYTSTSAHNFEYGIYSDTHHKYYCTDCGYIESTERHILKMTGAIDQYKPCSLCGAMVYTGGGNIYPVSPTKKDDLEEEIE